MRYKPTLFTQAGYCFVSINYRLSPRPASNDPARIKFPVHEQDVASAIAWVHDHIKDYGGDPTRIALAGHSAGAQLAALVSTDPKYLQAHGLGLEWRWQPITQSGARQTIDSMVEASRGRQALVLNYCDGDEVNGFPGLSLISSTR